MKRLCSIADFIAAWSGAIGLGKKGFKVSRPKGISLAQKFRTLES